MNSLKGNNSLENYLPFVVKASCFIQYKEEQHLSNHFHLYIEILCVKTNEFFLRLLNFVDY